jgi:integrase
MRNIKPINHSGSIQLKFSLGGKRYTFNPIPGGQYGDKRDIATAQAIATKIQNDILAGHFDLTLDRYRLVPKSAPNTQPKTLLELWDLWMGSLDLPEYTLANHYRWTKVMIVKASPGLTDTSWLTKSELSARTCKDRLSLVRSCCKWGLAKGLIETNPYENLKLRKSPPKEINPLLSL